MFKWVGTGESVEVARLVPTRFCFGELASNFFVVRFDGLFC